MNYEQTKFCPFCGGTIFESAEKCKHCGKWLNEQKKVCPYCYKEIPENATKCSFCGSYVKRKKSKVYDFVYYFGMIIIGLFAILLGFGELFESGNTDNMGGAAFIGIILLIIWNIYILPTHLANEKMHKHTNLILIVNLFFGCTLLGWIVALIWALNDE